MRYWREDLPLGADTPRTVAEARKIGASVVVIGPDIPTPAGLDIARAFDRQHRDICTVLVAPPSADLLKAALRAGTRDVIAPSSTGEELFLSLHHASEAARARREATLVEPEAEPPGPRVIMVMCPKGGAGKTTVSTNLGAGLGVTAPGRVVVVDLDLQFGDVASALALEPDRTITDATMLWPEIDQAGLEGCLTRHPEGFSVLCAPHYPNEATAITAEHIDAILPILASHFDYVVIDTAAGLDDAALAAIPHATDFVLLSATDVPSVRNTRKEVEALRMLAHADQRWHFVLNRADARTGLKMQAIEVAVGLTVDIAIPSSRAVPISLNRGVPIVLSDSRAPVALAMAQLVRRMTPLPTAARVDGPRGSRPARLPA